MDQKNQNVIERGLKLTGELFVLPGSSLLVDGKIKEGTLHAGAGFLASLALGLPGILAVAANSYSKSATGKSLLANLIGPQPSGNAYNLKETVQAELSDGLTLSEVTARVVEDIEDIYAEMNEKDLDGQG